MSRQLKLKVLILAIFAAISMSNNSAQGAYYGQNFTASDIGGTTYFSGDVSGSATKIGGTTYFNAGDKNYTASKIGNTMSSP